MVQECPLAKTHGGNLQRDLGENLLIQAMEEQLQLDTTHRILAGVILIWQNEAIRLLEDGVTPLIALGYHFMIPMKILLLISWQTIELGVNKCVPYLFYVFIKILKHFSNLPSYSFF